MIITNEEILNYLKTDDAADEVDVIFDIRDMAEQFISNYLDRQFELISCKEYYDGTSSKYIYLNKYPVDAVSIIRIYDDNERITYTDVDAAYYILYKDTGRLHYFYRFPRGHQNIYLEYTAGYTIIPNDIKYAIKSIVKKFYSQYNDNSDGLKSYSLGDQSISFEDGVFSKEVIKILDYYKRIPV